MYLLSFYLVLFNVCTRLIHEVPFFFIFSFSVYVCLFVCVSVSYLFGLVFSVISGSRAKKLKNRFPPSPPRPFSVTPCPFMLQGCTSPFWFHFGFFLSFLNSRKPDVKGPGKRNEIICPCARVSIRGSVLSSLRSFRLHVGRIDIKFVFEGRESVR